MPSRKQRRRRQKERRHEYEYVYVDDEGREVETPDDDSPRKPAGSSRNGKDKSRRAGGSGRGVREAQPPSWQRSFRRALLFFPLFFIVFSLVNKKSAIEARLLGSLAYSALFIPLTYMMDRTAYRAFLRRSGRAPDPKR
jgi:hypothetical protein